MNQSFENLSIDNLRIDDLTTGNRPQERDSDSMNLGSDLEEEHSQEDLNHSQGHQFLLVCEPSQYDLSNLDMEVVLVICKALSHAK